MIDPSKLIVNLDAFETGISIEMDRPGATRLVVCEVWPLSKLDGETHIRDDAESVAMAHHIVASLRACHGISPGALPEFLAASEALNQLGYEDELDPDDDSYTEDLERHCAVHKRYEVAKTALYAK